MSNYYSDYSQYLGAQQCCRNTVPIPGPTGPPGESAVGQMGYTGPTGASLIGPTGPRGCTGPTGSKSFIIDHPLNESQYLVHVCLEGPETGVYYRGKAQIPQGQQSVQVFLPNYASIFATDFSVQLTPINNTTTTTTTTTVLSVEEIVDGDDYFVVHGESGAKFYWLAIGKRYDIEVEPFKANLEVKGDGPYLYF